MYISSMIKYTLYLTTNQIDTLNNLDGQTSDHIRRAIDDYLIKKQVKATRSPSL